MTRTVRPNRLPYRSGCPGRCYRAFSQILIMMQLATCRALSPQRVSRPGLFFLSMGGLIARRSQPSGGSIRPRCKEKTGRPVGGRHASGPRSSGPLAGTVCLRAGARRSQAAETVRPLSQTAPLQERATSVFGASQGASISCSLFLVWTRSTPPSAVSFAPRTKRQGRRDPVASRTISATVSTLLSSASCWQQSWQMCLSDTEGGLAVPESEPGILTLSANASFSTPFAPSISSSHGFIGTGRHHQGDGDRVPAVGSSIGNPVHIPFSYG